MQPGTSHALLCNYPTTSLYPNYPKPLSHRQHGKLIPLVPSPRGPKQLQPRLQPPRPSSARRISFYPSRRRWRIPNRTSSRHPKSHLFHPVHPQTGRFHRATLRLISNKTISCLYYSNKEH